MKISVITPVLNGEKFIVKCINSIQIQMNCEFEHLIIDGGSKDKTIEIASKYNVKIISAPNTTIYEANNIGILNSTGDVICFLNSDDYFSDKFSLSRVTKHFQNSKFSNVLYGNVHIVNSEGELNYDYRPLKKFSYFLASLAMFIVPHSSTFFRRVVFEKHGLYDTDLKYSSDLEFILRLKKSKVQLDYDDYFYSSFTRHLANKSDEVGSSNDFKIIAIKHDFYFNPLIQKLVYLSINITNFKYINFLLKRMSNK